MGESVTKSGRTILLPIAPRTVDQLVDWAVSNCKGSGDVVHVLSVQRFEREKEIKQSSNGEALIVEMGHPSPELCKLLNTQVANRLADATIKFKVCVLQYFDPKKKGMSAVGQAICYKADQLQPDLVVLCKHQRGVLASMFVGSVTRYCQEHCTRPLVLL